MSMPRAVETPPPAVRPADTALEISGAVQRFRLLYYPFKPILLLLAALSFLDLARHFAPDRAASKQTHLVHAPFLSFTAAEISGA